VKIFKNFISVLGVISGITVFVTLYIDNRFLREKLKYYESMQIENIKKLSGKWNIIQYILSSSYKPYQDLKLEYIFNIIITPENEVKGIGEKYKENNKIIKRKYRSQLEIVSGKVVKDYILLVYKEKDYRGYESSGNIKIYFVTDEEFIGYGESSVAQIKSIFYGKK